MKETIYKKGYEFDNTELALWNLLQKSKLHITYS